MAKAVLVTGAGTGFGPEISLYLAEQGYCVYAGVEDDAAASELTAAAASRRVRIPIVPMCVGDQDSAAAAVRNVVAESGGIYAVVNNDTRLLRGYFEDISQAEMRAVFETNFFGTLATTRAALPYMRAAGRGRVIIISSVAGKIGAPAGSVYSASRFAQEGFAESLYQEVAPLGIQVTLIEPGITKTASWTVDRGAAERARDPHSPYYAWFNRSEQLFDRQMHRTNRTPREIARAVDHALSVARPRLRYVVGRQAGLVIGLRRYLPDRLFERLYFGEVMRRITRP